MKLFQKASDGGSKSGVTAYFLIELKSLFSIALLKFNPGSREAFHSHAFNAFTIWLKGSVIEDRLYMVHDEQWEELTEYKAGDTKVTKRDNMHKVIGGDEGAWALTFRGPWQKNWQEVCNDQTELVTLGFGREVVKTQELNER